MNTAANDTASNLPLFGSRYTGAWRDAAAIARDIRADIKAAVKSGELPAGLVCSVKSDKFSMGQSVTVKVIAAPGLVLASTKFARAKVAGVDPWENSEGLYSSAGKMLVAKLDRLVNAHQDPRERSDKHPLFFAHVDLDGALVSAQLAEIVAVIKAAA